MGIKKWLALLLMVIGIFLSGTEMAAAYADETGGDINGEEETSFSIPGNGEILDDISDDNTKQFLTIKTKNGNTFFLVLDYTGNQENVYMLSMIDENDLAGFLDEEETEPETQPVVIIEPEPVIKETEPEMEPVLTEKKDSSNMGAVVAVMALFAGGVGGFYYFKVLKAKKEEDMTESEDLEFFDEGSYINEDQAISDIEE